MAIDPSKFAGPTSSVVGGTSTDAASEFAQAAAASALAADGFAQAAEGSANDAAASADTAVEALNQVNATIGDAVTEAVAESTAAASASAIAAHTSELNAATSASVAQAAAASKGDFANTTLGLAGTTAGQSFTVTPSVVVLNTGLSDLYRNVAGAAVYLGTSPSALAVVVLQKNTLAVASRRYTRLNQGLVDKNGKVGAYTTNSGGEFSILKSKIPKLVSQTLAVASRRYTNLSQGLADKNGKLIAYTTNSAVQFNLSVSILSGKVGTLSQFATRRYSGASVLQADKNSKVVSGRMNDGTAIDPIGAVTNPPLRVPLAPLAASVFGVWGDGQSLAVGFNAGAVLTITQPYQNVMLTGGIIRPPDETGLLPAVEAVRETGFAAMANTISSQFTNKYPLTVCTMGVPSTALASHLPGQQYYTDLIAAVTAVNALVVARGDVYNIPIINLVQGEQDEVLGTLGLVWEQQAIQYADALARDIPAITGQPNRPIIALSQLSNWTTQTKATPTIAIAMVDLARKYPNKFLLIGPKYQYPYGADGLHLTADSYRNMGIDFTKPWMQTVVKGQFWKPLWPIPGRIRCKGNGIIADFEVPVPPMVIDTSVVTDPGGLGFEFYDPINGRQIATTAELIGNNSMHFIVPNSISPLVIAAQTARMRGGYTGTVGQLAGPTTGVRICLRDSATVPNIYTHPGGAAYQNFNYCVHFDEAISS